MLSNRKRVSDRLITSTLGHRERAIFMTRDKKRSQERAQGKIVVDNVINCRLSLTTRGRIAAAARLDYARFSLLRARDGRPGSPVDERSSSLSMMRRG